MVRQPLWTRVSFTITLNRHTTLGRTSLDEWSACHIVRQPLWTRVSFTITLNRHTTLGRTSLDEWPARHIVRQPLWTKVSCTNTLNRHTTLGRTSLDEWSARHMVRQPLWTKVSFTITLNRHTTLGRTSLDEWSARHRDLYRTTHNTHKSSTLPPGFAWILSMLWPDIPEYIIHSRKGMDVNVTLRRVRATIVVVKKNKYCIFRQLFVALGIQHAMRMRHSAIYGLSCSTTFSHII
jgi:hypothetical protein